MCNRAFRRSLDLVDKTKLSKQKDFIPALSQIWCMRICIAPRTNHTEEPVIRSQRTRQSGLGSERSNQKIKQLVVTRVSNKAYSKHIYLINSILAAIKVLKHNEVHSIWSKAFLVAIEQKKALQEPLASYTWLISHLKLIKEFTPVMKHLRLRLDKFTTVCK